MASTSNGQAGSWPLMTQKAKIYNKCGKNITI